jgi:hypothetical protein
MLILKLKCLNVSVANTKKVPNTNYENKCFNFHLTKIRRSRHEKVCVSHVQKVFCEHSYLQHSSIDSYCKPYSCSQMCSFWPCDTNIVVFSDIRAVTMTVCWHYLLFQFSNFEFPNLAI